MPRTFALAIGIAALPVLAGCTIKPKADPAKEAAARVAARRDQAACGSQVAYDKLKNIAFDAAIRARGGDHANLDTLADYSLARMEQPVVKGHDTALDLTECQGRLVLDLPPGAEAGFGGRHQLSTDVAYTAQAAADGNGYVYTLKGGDDLVAQLAAFRLDRGAILPPAAVDYAQRAPAAPPAAAPNFQPEPRIAAAPPQPRAFPAGRAAPSRDDRPDRPPPDWRRPPWQDEPDYAPPDRRPRDDGWRGRDRYDPGPDSADDEDDDAPPPREAGLSTVRQFYRALGTGDGRAASVLVIPEKRGGGAYSPQGIARFYGRLPEPLRLTAIEPAGPDAWRVRYTYSAGRTRCDGRALVSTTSRGGETYIRGIKPLSGC